MTGRVPLPLFWLAGLLAFYLLAPLVAALDAAGFADWHSIDTAALIRASLTSFASAGVATLVIAIGGIPLGYVLARKTGRSMSLIGFLVQLPLALPPLSSGILLLFLLGDHAPLGRLFHGALTDSFIGIVLAEVFVSAPFLVIAARSSFAAADPVLEGVSLTLGRGPLATFFRVSLPVAWPGITAGILLAWLRAFGEFGATVMVAYHPYSLPVYTYVAFGAQGLPAMLPIILPTLVIAFLVLALAKGAGQKRPARAGRGRSPSKALFGRSRGGRLAPLPAPGALTLQLEKKLGDFRIEILWTSATSRLAILGPSGSGKTLTLKLIAGLETADRASIVLGGRELGWLPPAQRGIAYVPQNYGLFPHLSIRRQLLFPKNSERGLFSESIERFHLQGLEDRLPSALSLGQQQRVALARAFMRACPLVLLDEPFSALDAPLRARLRRELLSLQRETTATTVLVTHDPQEAALLADELLVLADGRVLQTGSTAAVFRRPASEQVARLLGAEDIAEGVAVDEAQIAVGNGLQIGVAWPPLTAGQRVGWSVPPTRIRIGAGGRYRAVIEGSTPLGSGFETTLHLGSARLRAVHAAAAPREGQSCRVDIDPEAIQIWPLR